MVEQLIITELNAKKNHARSALTKGLLRRLEKL